ncbi:hypothetical protein [Klebsiella phage RothC]|uniref:Uncharacterized protein n=2 Tax=Viruses TaxID=10239 RepID=A0AB39C105_9CAUD
MAIRPRSTRSYSHFLPPETQKPRRFRQGLFILHAAT